MTNQNTESSLQSDEYFARRTALRERLILTVLLMVGAALRLAGPDLAYFSYHAARDIYRTEELIWNGAIPLLGSELQYGGRSLGPALYFIIAPALLLWKSPIAVSMWIGLLDVAAMFFLWKIVRRLFGCGVALWSTGFYAFFPLAVFQLRFLWNPSFLPLFLFIGLWGLISAVLDRRPWHFLAAVFGFSVAFQIHFSAIHAIICATLVFLAVRPKLPRSFLWAGAALATLLFSPALAAEFGQSEFNVARIVESDWFSRTGSRWRYNPNALEVFLYHVYPNPNEDPDMTGFTYLESFAKDGVNWYRPRTYMLLQWIEQSGRVQFILWMIGIMVCLAGCAAPRSVVETLGFHQDGASGDSSSVLARLPFAAVLLWQAAPLISLSFFDFHYMPEYLSSDVPGFIPLRYFVVAYPMPFVCTGLGVVALGRLTTMAATRIVRRAATRDTVFPAGLFIQTAAAVLLFGYVIYDAKILQFWSRSGRSVAYNYPNLVPSLRTMNEVRDILLGQARIDVAAFYEQVHHQQFAQHSLGEAGVDWVITQDARAWTNPPPDKHLRWLLHSPFARRGSIVDLRPTLPPGATEIRRWPIGPVGGMTLVEYSIKDPKRPLPLYPPHDEMRNSYFRYEIMPYLGPNREAAARAAGDLPRYPLPLFPASGQIQAGDAASDAYLVYGWSPPEESLGRRVRWMRRQGLLRFSLARDSVRTRSQNLRLAVWALPLPKTDTVRPGLRHLEIRLNDKLLGVVPVEPGKWSEVRFPLPDNFENFEIMLVSSEMPPSANDPRVLAVEYAALD